MTQYILCICTNCRKKYSLYYKLYTENFKYKSWENIIPLFIRVLIGVKRCLCSREKTWTWLIRRKWPFKIWHGQNPLGMTVTVLSMILGQCQDQLSSLSRKRSSLSAPTYTVANAQSSSINSVHKKALYTVKESILCTTQMEPSKTE